MSRRLRSVVAFSAFLLLGATDVPAPYPVIDDARAQPLVVVASLRAAGELRHPEPRCNDDHPEHHTVICLHDAYLLHARLVDTVYGGAPAADFDLAMTGHYGTGMYDEDPGPYLALVIQDGDARALATYASGRVFRDRTGDWVPPLYHVPGWLPCSVAGISQPLAQSQFSARDWQDIARNADFPPGDRTRFLVVGQKAWPTTGLSVRRLAVHLAQSQPALSGMFCKSPGD